MPAKKPDKKTSKPTARAKAKPGGSTSSAAVAPTVDQQVRESLAWLERHGSSKKRDEMGPRYGITGPSAEKAFGVPMSAIKSLGKQLGRNHDLAAALWETGNYEARMLASFVGEADLLTPAQMDRWVKEFDNWAYCDALCFNLFDRSPHAFAKVAQWAASDREFVKRTAFALLWSLALHDKSSGDAPFLKCLPLIERAATDERNFVKKAVSMALRAVGRRSTAVNNAATALAQRLIESPDTTARWVGRDSIKELTKKR